MLLIEQTILYKEYMVEKAFERRIAQLSDWLMASLSVTPLGKELCGAIDDERCSTNQSVVNLWVRTQVCCASCIRTVNRQNLKKNFVRWLLDHEFWVGDLH